MLIHFDTYAASQSMEVLNAYTGTEYFIPPAYGQNGLSRRNVRTTSEINEQLLDIYPNPADYMITLQLKEALPNQEMCTLFVTDVMGRAIYSQQVNPALQQLVLNTEQWATGLYVFKIVIPHSTIEINGKFEVLH